MASVKQAAAAFLANHRGAVTGVSAVNPNPDTVEGDPATRTCAPPRAGPGGGHRHPTRARRGHPAPPDVRQPRTQQV